MVDYAIVHKQRIYHTLWNQFKENRRIEEEEMASDSLLRRKADSTRGTFRQVFPYLSLYPSESRLPISLIEFSKEAEMMVTLLSEETSVEAVVDLVERTDLRTKANRKCSITTSLPDYKHDSPHEMVTDALKVFDFVHTGHLGEDEYYDSLYEQVQRMEDGDEILPTTEEANEKLNIILDFLDLLVDYKRKL